MDNNTIDNIRQCFRDSYCQTGGDNIFNMGGGFCLSQARNYCLGDDTSTNYWLNRWIESVNGIPRCGSALLLTLDRFGPDDCRTQLQTDTCTPLNTLGINLKNSIVVEQIVVDAVKRFINEGGNFLANPNEDGYSLFPEAIYNDICCKYPFLCNSLLNDICSNVTMEQVESDSTKKKFCGCHMNASQYEKYTALMNISKECTPTCNLLDTIKNTGVNGEPVLCKENVCIVSSVNFFTDGDEDVSYDQVCGNCNVGQCYCVIQDSDIALFNSEIEGNVKAVLNKCNAVIKNTDLTDISITPEEFNKDVIIVKDYRGYLITLGISVFLIFIAIIGFLILIKFVKKKK